MRSLPIVAAGAVALAGLIVVGVTTSVANAAPADTAYALSGSSLLSFDTADPSKVTTTLLTGVTAGETLVGLDVRPQNGELYALGVNATDNTGSVYVVHEQSGFAAVVGVAGSVTFTTNGSTVVDLPDPATTGYGFDINPAADRIRVTAGALNFRLSPNSGAPVDGDNGGGAGSASGVNPDGAVNGGTTTIDGSAYTNDLANSSITTLYTLDATSNSLFIQNPANNGTQTLGIPVTLGGSSLDFSAIGGFDIPTGVNAAASGTAVTSGSGYAVLSVGGATKLYAINLVSGAATVVGTVGNGTVQVQGLALQRDVDDGYPAIGLNAAGNSLVRFSTTTPGTTTTVAVNTAGLNAGETLAAAAWRTQTGQFYGLGVNATANTGTLYLIDPQTGAVTGIGTPGQLAWVQADGSTPVDLPDPATTGYGLDANPAVDRVRVVAGTGLNARVNPNNGAPVDGNNGSGTVPGVNPDGSPVPPMSSIAFTNAFGSALTGSAPTTLYALDAAANQLVIVNPSNAGTVTTPVAVTLGGATLDFGSFPGLDVPEDVAVATSGAPATGTAYAALTVGGQPGLYTIDLTTGRATSVGTMLASLRSLTLGQSGANRPVVTPPPPAPTAVPATLVKVGKAKQRGKVIDTGRSLKCPAGFLSTSCTTTIKVTATYKVKVKGKTRTRSAVVGKATVKAARGKTSRLKVSLSKKGVKLLKQRSALTVKIAITAPTGPKAAKRTTTVKVTLRKKKL